MISEGSRVLMERLGFGGDVDGLESYIKRVQVSAYNGEPEVTDKQYDTLIGILKEVKPDSDVLDSNWELDDYEYGGDTDSLLKENRMMSIKTIQKIEELNYFIKLLDKLDNGSGVDMYAAFKLNGHATRRVYEYGKLVSATTRGRRKKGRDITKQMAVITKDYIPELVGIPRVEIRGEVLISSINFDKVSHRLRTPLSTVTSFLRDSFIESELLLLDCVDYQIITNDIEFENLLDKYKYLKGLGLQIPYCIKINKVKGDGLFETIKDLVNLFEEKYKKGYPYDCDGIVVGLNNLEMFNRLGESRNTYIGNFALKLGSVWESKTYCGKILGVEWSENMSQITPTAIVDVIVSNGNRITSVPLYNIGVMQRYKYYTGNDVYFEYGGETGVTAVSPDGKTVRQ